jgi:hypothetical protein
MPNEDRAQHFFKNEWTLEQFSCARGTEKGTEIVNILFTIICLATALT